MPNKYKIHKKEKKINNRKLPKIVSVDCDEYNEMIDLEKSGDEAGLIEYFQNKLLEKINIHLGLNKAIVDLINNEVNFMRNDNFNKLIIDFNDNYECVDNYVFLLDNYRYKTEYHDSIIKDGRFILKGARKLYISNKQLLNI